MGSSQLQSQPSSRKFDLKFEFEDSDPVEKHSVNLQTSEKSLSVFKEIELQLKVTEEEKLKEMESHLDNLKSNLTETQEVNLEMRNELLRSKDTLNKKQKDIEELHSKLEEKNEEIEGVREQFMKIQTQLDSLERTYQDKFDTNVETQ